MERPTTRQCIATGQSSSEVCSPLISSPLLRCSPVPIAAGGVGKSALTVRFVDNVFLSNYDPTIEGPPLFLLGDGRLTILVKQKSMSAQPKSMAHPIRCGFSPWKKVFTNSRPQLEILDTAGADQFHTLNERYIKVRSRPPPPSSSHVILTRPPR